MKKEIFVADDRGIIPDYIKNMTDEELDAEIARLEAKIIAEKQRILEREKKAS